MIAMWLGIVTCVLALVMAVQSAIRLHRTDNNRSRPYVLPVFVGLSYALLNSLSLYDLIVAGQPRMVVQLAGQFVQTMLIVSVIMLLNSTRRG